MNFPIEVIRYSFYGIKLYLVVHFFYDVNYKFDIYTYTSKLVTIYYDSTTNFCLLLGLM